MPTKLHEDILDDWRAGTCDFLYHHPEYQPTFLGIDGGFNFFPGNLRPDGSILPGEKDGYGAIAVEVGRMHDGKWSHIVDSDGLPVRVLRIGFDRGIYWINPRHTEFEKELTSHLDCKFKSSRVGDVKQEFLK